MREGQRQREDYEFDISERAGATRRMVSQEYHVGIHGLIYGIYDAKPEGFVPEHEPSQHDAAPRSGQSGFRARKQF